MYDESGKFYYIKNENLLINIRFNQQNNQINFSFQHNHPIKKNMLSY